MAHFKKILQKIYPIFPHQGYIYYIREAEFRSQIFKMNNEKLISLIYKIFKNVYEFCGFSFSDGEEIKDFSNYNYYLYLH